MIVPSDGAFRLGRLSRPTSSTFGGALTGGSIAAAGLDPPLRGGVHTGQLPAALTIGDFSRATHLSIKTLRHYHRVALLAPAHVDADTG
jgi:hypothetical protein